MKLVLKQSGISDWVLSQEYHDNAKFSLANQDFII